MKTRTGKIARLPKPIREQLNARLENGEPGTALVAWLNQLPEVQKIITDQFAGLPIRPQNLSEWRQGGYLDWTRHQLLREQTRWTAEQAAELGIDTSGASISIAEDIATVMSAELTLHVQTMSALKNPKERFRQFCRLSRELSRLRRDDQRAIRNQLLHKQSQSTPESIEENSGTGVPPVSSTPVGRDSVEPKLPPHQPPVGRASRRAALRLKPTPPTPSKLPSLSNPPPQSARGLAHSKTLRATRKPPNCAPASRTAVALYRLPMITPQLPNS